MFYDWEDHNKNKRQPGGCLIPAIVSILTAVLTTLAIRGWL